MPKEDLNEPEIVDPHEETTEPWWLSRMGDTWAFALVTNHGVT